MTDDGVRVQALRTVDRTVALGQGHDDGAGLPVEPRAL